MQPNNPASLQLTYLVPTVSYDGTVVNISNNGVPSIAFFQGRKQEDNIVSADVVASIRFNNMADLKELQKTIQETIDNSSKREK